MNIGYARVSAGEQTLDLQLDALAKAEFGKVFAETAGGVLVERATSYGKTKPLPTSGRGTRSWSGGSTGWAAPSST